MVALKSSVTASQSGTQIADTFTCSGYYLLSLTIKAFCYNYRARNYVLTSLFSCRPKRVCEVFGADFTTYRGSLPICSDLDAVQLAQIDLNTISHRPQSGDRSVHAIGSKNRKRVLIRKFDLSGGKISRLLPKNQWRREKDLLSQKCHFRCWGPQRRLPQECLGWTTELQGPRT
jgi:hypothetical protein